jgi:hypothetical protein
MAKAHEMCIKNECLLQELGIWKFTVTGRSNLFDKNAFLKEFLGFKMDIAEGFIEEFHS